MSKKEKLQTTHLIIHRHMKKFTVWFFLLVVLPVLTNHDGQFISRGQACFNFMEYFPLKASLHNDQLNLPKLREGVIFSRSSTICQQLAGIIFLMKAKCPSFYFLDLSAKILNFIQPKISKNGQNFYHFFKIFLFNPLYNFQIEGQVYRLIIYRQAGFVQHKNQQPTCSQVGARTCGKVKIPKVNSNLRHQLFQCFLQYPFIIFRSQDIWNQLNVTFRQTFWFHFLIQEFCTAVSSPNTVLKLAREDVL